MNAQKMLAMAGFPDTAEGRKAFYKQYPDEQSFHKKMKTGGSSGLAFPQQPTAGEFYAPQYTPNSPVGFYQNGGLAYPQQPPADMFFSGHPFTPEYASGGMPCMNCGGYMDDGGQASPFGYGQMPPAIGMAYGGSAKSFSKAMKKYFDDGGTASQGSTMEQNYLTDINNLKRFIGGNVTNALSTEVYNQEQQQPVYDLGGEDTFNYGQADQLNAMQTGLDMSEQQRQYQKQQNLSNLINSYALGGRMEPTFQPGGESFQRDSTINYDEHYNSPLNRFHNNAAAGNSEGDVAGWYAAEKDLKKKNPMQLSNASVAKLGLQGVIPTGTTDIDRKRILSINPKAVNQGEGDTWTPGSYGVTQDAIMNRGFFEYQMGGLPQAQMGNISDADRSKRMFGQSPNLGKTSAPLFFGHTQGATAANATSGSLNPEMTAKGNQLAQDIHNFNPSGAGVQFTPEQIKYLQQHGYGQQQQNSVWNPGYKVRAKGWENSADGTKGNKWRSKGTSDSPFPTFGASGSYQAQRPGQGSFDMSHGLNAQQVADMNKYYEAHGMHMDYKQKNGLLGKWLGPKSYEMHIGSLNDYNQKHPAQSAQSPTAPSSSNPSGGGFHPFDGMRERMAERKAGRSARLAAKGERMSDEDFGPNANVPTHAYGGAPSVYFPHGYQEGGANEVENDNDADDNDYEYMDENEIAAYMAAGGVIKYV